VLDGINAGQTYSRGDPDIFGKQNALEFNDDKVDKLFDIIHEALQRVFTDSIVFLGTELGCEATAEGGLTSNFGEGSDWTVSQRSSL
jgi:hypothetical protein